MHVAWCPKHRGVMRIAFFDPPPKHFYDPCPRPNCGQPIKHQIRNKYAVDTPKEVNLEQKTSEKETSESRGMEDILDMLFERPVPAPTRHHLMCECLRCGGYKDPSYYV